MWCATQILIAITVYIRKMLGQQKHKSFATITNIPGTKRRSLLGILFDALAQFTLHAKHSFCSWRFFAVVFCFSVWSYFETWSSIEWIEIINSICHFPLECCLRLHLANVDFSSVTLFSRFISRFVNDKFTTMSTYIAQMSCERLHWARQLFRSPWYFFECKVCGEKKNKENIFSFSFIFSDRAK